MGKLRTLLQWHEGDPPSSEEIARNELLCADYQHNRNPFIDFPDLVPLIYQNDDDSACPECPDSAPEDEDADDDFFVESPVKFDPGDVVIIGFNSDAPKSLLLLALTGIPTGANFYVTDNGYLGSSFRTGEGTLKFTATADIAAGTTLTWIDGDDSTSSSFGDWAMSDSFVLSTSGDQVYVYTLSSDMSHNFVWGLQYRAGSWDDAVDVDSSTKGALPSDLSSGNFAVALTHHDNKKWDGGGLDDRLKEVYLASVVDSSRWEGSNADIYTFVSEAGAFTVDPPVTSSPTRSPTTSPTSAPTNSPTKTPTKSPSSEPAVSPTAMPTIASTNSSTNTTNSTLMSENEIDSDIDALILSSTSRLLVSPILLVLFIAAISLYI